MLGRDVKPENAVFIDIDPTITTNDWAELNSIHQPIRQRMRKADINTYVDIVTFTVQHVGATTICILRIRNYFTGVVMGVARCSANDEYNLDIGRKLAISRAIRKAYELYELESV